MTSNGAVRLRDLGVSFDHGCFACGDQNEAGMHVDIAVTSASVVVRCTASERHQGYDGVLHGGTVTALLDEAMAWATYVHRAAWGMTARLAVAFRAPVEIGAELVVTGRITRDRGRLIETAGTLARASDGATLATAEATFMAIPESRREEMARRYGMTERVLEMVRDAVGWDVEAVAAR